MAFKRSSRHERQKVKHAHEIEEYNRKQEEYDNKLKHEKQKYKFKSILSALRFETYTKRLVGFVVILCMVDLQLSYILAFMDKVQIAEALSTQICVTILGTVIIYAIRAYFDTKAEKRDEMIRDGLISADTSRPIKIPDGVIKDKVSEILSNSGLSEHISNDEPIQTENPEDSSNDIVG